MPRWKFIANRFLTTIQNRIMGTRLSEAHTGYHAYSRELLLTVPFLRNLLDFVFDSELFYQASYFGFRIREVPPAAAISTRCSRSVSGPGWSPWAGKTPGPDSA